MKEPGAGGFTESGCFAGSAVPRFLITMIKNFEELNFDVIAWSDRSFRLTYRRCPQLLLASVREVGVLNPLIVSEGDTPDRYRIVTGWLRFEAARAADRNSVPCHVYSNFPSKLMLLCGLFDNIGHRQLNPMEKALALQRLSEHYTKEEIVENFLPMIGGANGTDVWHRAQTLTKMPETLQWALADGALDEQAALTLMALPVGSPERVYDLMKSLGMSPAMQRDAATMFFEIWERDDTTPVEIIEQEQWGEFLTPRFSREPMTPLNLEREIAGALGADDIAVYEGGNVLEPGARPRMAPDEITPPARPHRRVAKADQVFMALRRRRFPHLRAVEETYGANVEALELPKNARLTPAPYFESTAQKLEVKFNSPGQLRHVLTHLLNAEERGLISKVFDCLKT